MIERTPFFLLPSKAEELFMPVCLWSQPSCHASLKFAGYSNLLNGDILKMSNLKLSQPGVKVGFQLKADSYQKKTCIRNR